MKTLTPNRIRLWNDYFDTSSKIGKNPIPIFRDDIRRSRTDKSLLIDNPSNIPLGKIPLPEKVTFKLTEFETYFLIKVT